MSRVVKHPGVTSACCWELTLSGQSATCWGRFDQVSVIVYVYVPALTLCGEVLYNQDKQNPFKDLIQKKWPWNHDELRKPLTTNVCNWQQLKYRPPLKEMCSQHAVTSTDYVCACSNTLGSFYSILTHDAVDDRWLLGNEDILTAAFVQYPWKRDG